MSDSVIRNLALMQHLGQDFFILNEIAYVGKEEDAREEFAKDIEDTEEVNIDANFEIFCSNNLETVEEYDVDSYDNDYLVLTDSEADEKAKEYILDSVWAFNDHFLAEVTGHDVEVFQAIIDNGRCERNNKAILALIDDEDYFVDAAISADGRAHFIAFYDHIENEETVDGETFYIYRLN
jgi:hypothetical protein